MLEQRWPTAITHLHRCIKLQIGHPKFILPAADWHARAHIYVGEDQDEDSLLAVRYGIVSIAT